MLSLLRDFVITVINGCTLNTQGIWILISEKLILTSCTWDRYLSVEYGLLYLISFHGCCSEVFNFIERPALNGLITMMVCQLNVSEKIVIENTFLHGKLFRVQLPKQPWYQFHNTSMFGVTCHIPRHNSCSQDLNSLLLNFLFSTGTAL